MKIILLFFLLIPAFFMGCSTSTGINCNDPNYIPPYMGVVNPGNFLGTWNQSSITDSCLIAITEGDTVLKATITNSKTGEILTINGLVSSGVSSPCGYRWRTFEDWDSTHSNSLTQTSFINNGNTIFYIMHSADPIKVNGNRQ